jgi:predicted TIM-barrel fold metal-dependent hydrolase
MSKVDLVDVHAHFLPPEYVAAAERAGHQRPDGMPGWPAWSERRHLELMDSHGIARSLLSVASPGVHFGDDFRARVLARQVNEAAAAVGRRHPGRFGFFASLPLPDVEGAVAEVEYAYGVLAADGVVLTSNAGGHYPGDPSWDQLWRALDDRAAVVLLHPTSPPQWRQVALDRPRPMIEFLFDNARAVVDLVLTGILDRYPRIRFIVTHAGGLLPLLADRIDVFQRDPSLPSVSSQLQTLWYDVASPDQLPADHVLFGTGYCCTSADHLAIPAPAARARTTANAHNLFQEVGASVGPDSSTEAFVDYSTG